MKAPAFRYLAPATLAEALRLLAGAERPRPGGRTVARGHAEHALRLSRCLIDINRVAELAYLRESDGGIEIGAMTRQRDVEFSPLVPGACRCGAKPSCRSGIARPATGALWRQPVPAGSAELPTVALAMDAELTAASVRGAAAADGGFLRGLHDAGAGSRRDPDEHPRPALARRTWPCLPRIRPPLRGLRHRFGRGAGRARCIGTIGARFADAGRCGRRALRMPAVEAALTGSHGVGTIWTRRRGCAARSSRRATARCPPGIASAWPRCWRAAPWRWPWRAPALTKRAAMSRHDEHRRCPSGCASMAHPGRDAPSRG